MVHIIPFGDALRDRRTAWGRSHYLSKEFGKAKVIDILYNTYINYFN
ncbi:MAG: hypothetical protein AAFW70_02505 [Cyanobacteria bacterium J06635_10]